jgi:hypothetical protein
MVDGFTVGGRVAKCLSAWVRELSMMWFISYREMIAQKGAGGKEERWGGSHHEAAKGTPTSESG